MPIKYSLQYCYAQRLISALILILVIIKKNIHLNKRIRVLYISKDFIFANDMCSNGNNHFIINSKCKYLYILCYNVAKVKSDQK